ncbi:Myosin-7a binding protein [Carabus blaptoides fortunei]
MEYDFKKKEALASSEYRNILRHLTNASPEMWVADVRESVGVLAGVVSGICYVFIQGLRSAGTRRGKYGVNSPWQCCICGSHFRPFGGGDVRSAVTVREVRRYAVCSRCHGHVCRSTCGQWMHGDWICKQCIQTSDVEHSWFKGILTALQPNAVTVRMSKGEVTAGGTDVKGISEGQNEEKEVVRDFIERLVGAMLGANLDDTSVGRLYGDPEYLPVTGQTPCTAHASLKNIIRRVLRDASNIAILKEPQTETASAADTTQNRTYEDLLATAILNKVIDNYQTDLRRSSSGSSASKKSSSSKKHKNKRHNDEQWQVCDNPDLDTTSVSSVEEWCRSESSCGSKYVDHMSFTIKQSIEEISTSDDEPTNNQYLHSCNLSRNSHRSTEQEDSLQREDWQDNWLFSRKGKGSPKPVPVPMLVPNPSTEFRALIGDRDAEDTSDLSETGSDIEDTESMHDIKTILVDSRTIIGGKNLIDKIDPEIFEPELQKEEIPLKENESCDGEVQKQEEVLVNSVEVDAVDDEVSEAKNGALIQEAAYVESDSLGSNTEKDMEYTERYASIPRQISKNKSPMPSPRTSKNSIDEQQREEIITHSNRIPAESIEGSSDEDETPPSITGSYSEKEKQKWRNPIALANNPYSKENLDKRLQNKSQINDNYSFGRDYYVREAKKSSGGRHKLVNNDSWLERSEHSSDQEEPMSPVSENNIDKPNEHIYTAVPAAITEEPEITKEVQNGDRSDCEEPVPQSRPISLAFSTDSEDVDVRRVYNVETGKLYKYKSKNITEEVKQQSKSPEGIKYVVKPTEFSVSSDLVENKFDENHNETQKIPEKEPIMSISKINHLITLSGGERTKQINVINVESNDEDEEPEIVEKNELVQDANIQPIPMRDISKKYLQSLVKNNNVALKMEMINSYATPPISLQEYSEESAEQTNSTVNHTHEGDDSSSCDNSITTPPVNLDEYTNVNTIEIETENENDMRDYPKSCIDLRFINQNGHHGQFSLSEEESSAYSMLFDECTKSTPNLMDERLYHSENNDDDYYSKPMRTIELENLENMPMPSVSNLKKLFDSENKIEKGTLLRTKSHLTTRPEINKHQIHSLTARSLPQGVRQELKKTSDEKDEIIVEQNGISKDENEESEITDKDELKTMPACKSKIQFFEQLKSTKA